MADIWLIPEFSGVVTDLHRVNWEQQVDMWTVQHEEDQACPAATIEK